MTALLLGSISTLADTSEIQRESFNKAFAQHDLDWEWSREDYRERLRSNGGQDRIAEYAEGRGEDVDASAVHATKSRIFQDTLTLQGVEPRPGVVETLRAARDGGMKVALVTTTSPDNVEALAQALSGEIVFDDVFDLVVDATMVEDVKPRPTAYEHALRELDEQAGGCVAVEDNVGGVSAARAAGIACVAFPNANTADHDFSAADRVTDRLDLGQLSEVLGR